MQKPIQKISALYLFWYVIVFLLVVLDTWQPFLFESMRNILARYPYAYDFEFLFTILFVVWGTFLWNADKTKDTHFLAFTSWAFLAQGLATIILALVLQKDVIHLLTDSIPWLILGFLLLITRNKKQV